MIESATRITANNISTIITEYLLKLRQIRVPACGENVVDFIRWAKRDSLGSGPYPNVSMFEAFNRILSDLVVLFGIRRLLMSSEQTEDALPYTSFEVALGHEDGNDIRGFEPGAATPGLLGEAFNVSQSYVARKRKESLAKLRSRPAKHRVIVFNRDALRSQQVEYWQSTSRTECLYLLLDVDPEIASFQT